MQLPAILTLAVSLLACAGSGRLWLRLLGHKERPDLLAGVHALALGLGTLAYLILAAGLLHLLNPLVLGLLLAVGWGAAVPWGMELRRKPSSDLIRQDPSPAGAESGRTAVLLLTAFNGLLVLATLLVALRPPDGLEWDSLSYHLAAPKIYLREGGIPFIAYDSHTHFPFTMQMLYTLGLQFGGTGAAKLFHWAAGWLTALAIGVWTSRLEVNGTRLPDWAGPLAAAVFASMPIVLWELGTAYVDLGTALFQFLALAALLDAVRAEDGRPEVSLGGAALAGILSGFALGTKMTALLQFGLLGLGLLWIALRAGKSRGAVARAFLLFGAAGVLVGSPWYIKSWLWVHNPVYPFFFSLFPQSFSWTREAAEAYSVEQASFGLRQQLGAPLSEVGSRFGEAWRRVREASPGAALGALAAALAHAGQFAAEALRQFVTVPWNLGMHGRDYYINFRSLTGDRLGSLGPVWSGVIPLALWTRGFPGRVSACLLYGLASVGVWLFLTQQTRYLMPVFAPLAVVVAVTVALLPSLLRKAAAVFLSLALFLSLGIYMPIVGQSLPVVLGQISEEEYLLAGEVGPLYQAARFVNRLPETSRVALYQETRGFYFDRRYFWANPLQHNLIPYRSLQNGDELVRELRRFGITHALINYSFSAGTEQEQWRRLLGDAIQRGRLVEVFRSEGAEIGRRGVMVYELR